ncbi:uncharacterized protein [Malus domestica]|uniref:uncharacterized protein isoform X2 n=1 Tax=Malus domestica TaxID=3750 RepID=UPI0010A9BD5F|nr:uncharacterized protein LOC103406692 isoform X1 [Malus domestica]XP_028964168.1 uncharacterized protein LOC103406692 isoform X1 [Malus domestica]XP_028964172.1 uncharacterized protein LOC103406692 isoform X1 [Malus domestica]XP_028964173.1 uncharacterized protein LOC103406692 isoform X1 [Malus domestica]XP_028964177.1 uncharacterized protein LOC103406692 isoform X1 [Malus domestica]XP_028964179.1 uncharacterized protein LOC103406692 isoform X1 [Malus domestica]XP_028964184.1 uncharacterize
MRDLNGTIATDGVCSRTTQLSPRAVPAYANILPPIRLKRTSSILRDNNIDHLPESLLVEILCRLPCFKSVSQCKLVSKRWCSLLSDPHFIRLFLCVQRNRKKKPTGSAISIQGEEFLSRVSPSSRPLAQLFKGLVSIHGLKQEPIVVGAYNDLVLCCASEYSQRDYYICNPHTVQWVPLPPPPQVYSYVTVGFTCDLPFYDYKKDDQQGDIIQLNAEYKFRVVRLIDPRVDDDDDDDVVSCEIEAQIFFSETGEWREFVLSSPSAIAVGDLCRESIGVASNKMMYWLGGGGEFLIGFDPFMIDNSDNTRTHYKCFFSECGEWDSGLMDSLVTLDGRPRMCVYDSPTRTLSIWEVYEAKEGDQTVMIHGGAGSLCVRRYKSVYLGDEEMVVISPNINHIRAVVFDPNNEDLVYLVIDSTRDWNKKDVIRCNTRTREMSKVLFAPVSICASVVADTSPSTTTTWRAQAKPLNLIWQLETQMSRCLGSEINKRSCLFPLILFTSTEVQNQRFPELMLHALSVESP